MPANTPPPGGKVYQPQLRQIAKVPVLKTKSPDFSFELWKGYWNMPDPTTLTSLIKESVLTYPSVNCSIPYNDMVVPDKGKTILGVPYTETVSINGQYTKYVNKNGDQMEVRTWRSVANIALGDVVEVYWTNPVTGISSWVRITENNNPLDLAKTTTDPITNITSIQRFKFTQWSDVSLNGISYQIPRLIWVNGTTEIKSWTGGITVVGTVTGTTVQTQSGKTWDSLGFPNLTPAPQTLTGVNITVNGILYTVTGGWDTDTLTMASTAGISTGDIAISPPNQVTATNDLTINYAITSGMTYFVPNETVTGSVSGATGIVSSVTVGQAPVLTVMPLTGTFVGTDSLTGSVSGATGTITNLTLGAVTFDYCDTLQNYVLYGNWTSKQFYISNEYNYIATQTITGSAAVQNDMTVSQSSAYTGLGYHTYTVTIDSTHPEINIQNFYSVTGGVNNASILTNGTTQYIGVGENKYTLAIVSDFEITHGAVTGTWTLGEIVTGSTSLATAIVVFDVANTNLELKWKSGVFQPSETITGRSSGAHTTSIIVRYRNSWQFFKNGLQQFGAGTVTPVITGTTTLLDGLTIIFPALYSYNVGDYWTLDIQNESADTYSVSVDGNPPVAGETGISIVPQSGTLTFTLTSVQDFVAGTIVQGSSSGAIGTIQSTNGTSTMTLVNVLGIFEIAETISTINQTIQATGTSVTYIPIPIDQPLLQNNNQGIQIGFSSAIGHTVGDTWTITASQSVTNGYASFYYDLPVRLPGQGYIATLPSNFWTMGNQENTEYINMQNGQWWYFQRILSRNDQQETLVFEPLKVACSNKCIDPWLIGYMENDLIFVGIDKVLNLIGRLELIQLPQIGNLSKPVQNDFNNGTFTGGTIVYMNKILNITSPQQSIQFQYNNNVGCKYWNPPKTFSENGMQSIIQVNGENVLITHSNFRNQSFTMFTNSNGDGENNDEYTITIRTPYEIFRNRWIQKQSNMAFSEGYITGKPPLIHTVFCDVNGSSGIFPHIMQPVVDSVTDTSSLGQGSNGSHPLGSDTTTASGYWHEIWPNYADSLNWRFLAIQIDCTTTSHTYSFLSLGMNAIDANFNNNPITQTQSVLPM